MALSVSGINSLTPVSGHSNFLPNLLSTAPCVPSFSFLARVKAQLLCNTHITKFSLFLFPAKE